MSPERGRKYGRGRVILWDRIFQSFYQNAYGSGREEKVLEYAISVLADTEGCKDLGRAGNPLISAKTFKRIGDQTVVTIEGAEVR